jgi:hypothetical protein
MDIHDIVTNGELGIPHIPQPDMKEAFQEIPFREGYFPFLQDHHRDTT